MSDCLLHYYDLNRRPSLDPNFCCCCCCPGPAELPPSGSAKATPCPVRSPDAPEWQGKGVPDRLPCIDPSLELVAHIGRLPKALAAAKMLWPVVVGALADAGGRVDDDGCGETTRDADRLGSMSRLDMNDVSERSGMVDVLVRNTSSNSFWSALRTPCRVVVLWMSFRKRRAQSLGQQKRAP